MMQSQPQQHYHEAATLTANSIIQSFMESYRAVHQVDPQIVHMFAEWYQINGETVHRITVFQEITRLRTLAAEQRAQQRKPPQDRGLITRLIARLRGV
jgi:hypothetical protein